VKFETLFDMVVEYSNRVSGLACVCVRERESECGGGGGVRAHCLDALDTRRLQLDANHIHYKFLVLSNTTKTRCQQHVVWCR
jgi:hypothetical protein